MDSMKKCISANITLTMREDQGDKIDEIGIDYLVEGQVLNN